MKTMTGLASLLAWLVLFACCLLACRVTTPDTPLATKKPELPVQLAPTSIPLATSSQFVGLEEAAPLRSLTVEPPSRRSAAPPTLEPDSFEIPPGLLWRIGGEKEFGAHERFLGLWGLDYDPTNDLIFAADTAYDVQVVEALSYIDNPHGQVLGRFNHPDMRFPQDVKMDAGGKVYVAAWGSGKVLVFGPLGGGEPLLVFGEHGRGNGQFGDVSPGYLAVGADGRIYVHDNNTNEQGDFYERIMVFSPLGEWLQNITIPAPSFSTGGMDVGPDGNLYVAGFIGSKVLKFSPDGELLAELGEDAIRSVNGGPKGIALDQQGNMYLALWTGGIVKLNPDGGLLGQWGVRVDNGESPWAEGGFYQPSGVAVLPDGSQVFFTDTSSRYAYLTAFTFDPGGTLDAHYAEWASGAEATSEDYDRGLFAQRAAGEPDASSCGSPGAAWAPANTGGVESITLYYYDPPLIPSQVNIVISNHPSQVVKVELIDANGERPEVVVYEGKPEVTDQCPYVLSIPVKGIDYLVVGVRITIDLSSGAGVSEIDAVQLLGNYQ